MQLLCTVLTIYWFICIARVIFSFIPMDDMGGFMSAAQGAVYSLTEPVFATARQALPRMGDIPIDLGAILVFVIIGVLRGIVC